MVGWRKPFNSTQIGGWATCSLTRTQRGTHQNRKQTPTKATETHVGGEQIKKKDPNAMDVDALTMEERGMLLRQGKCFCCKKTGHVAKYCPPEQGESSKQKKVEPARFAYTMIKALTKEQRESFTKMVMEDKDGEDF
jgi:hypothetical protein